ncbi:hypothetical protein PUNSTDRAFT_138293 [Punctularia strigosozonata HHB-11173 SS5]|uniref:Uncharacterized protein n=1 Tax=Punctularia strigosozonata (strain HHB-11173) TaxID=741275 RepID=R7S4B9_PUNST|nr:uncharacterized protein PUNSTDRAFT_138293 [Punctularia strigosozonata HHB-11173 SS5]EIN04642.1 hypothetical protein PUNSTDRAFT_138293 [Punctularia strigosozonata HHB-11173 SS5]
MFMTVPVEELVRSQILFRFVEEEGGLIYEIRPLPDTMRPPMSLASSGTSLNFQTTLDDDGRGRGLCVFATMNLQDNTVTPDYTSGLHPVALDVPDNHAMSASIGVDAMHGCASWGSSNHSAMDCDSDVQGLIGYHHALGFPVPMHTMPATDTLHASLNSAELATLLSDLSGDLNDYDSATLADFPRRLLK